MSKLVRVIVNSDEISDLKTKGVCVSIMQPGDEHPPLAVGTQVMLEHGEDELVPAILALDKERLTQRGFYVFIDPRYLAEKYSIQMD
jgi:hypothetical protein